MSKLSQYPSPLRYPGGKQKQAKWIKDYFPEHMDIYIEPFIGGGGVGITLLREKEIYLSIFNDFDKEVYNFWKGAKEQTLMDLTLLQEVLDDKELGADYIKETYWETILNNAHKDSVCYLLRNKMSFNGLKSFSKLACERNFGQSTIDRYVLLSQDLKETEITNEHYWEVIKNSNDKTWIYADPPYITASQNLYKDHDKFDHREFAINMKQCDIKGANIVISYDDCDFVREHFPESAGWHFYEYQWSYSMTNNKEGNATTKGKELIITNFNANLIYTQHTGMRGTNGN